MEMSLENRNWKEFLFPEIFMIEKGFYNKKPESSSQGNIAFLGATANNNGITEFYTLKEIENNSKAGYGKNEPLLKKIFKGNCIAVTNNGSVGHAYYQIKDFTCSHDINPIYLKNHILNRYLAMFLIATIEKQKVCFEYARKWRPIRMVKSKILLPTTSKGDPDYSFMETCMHIKEQEKIKAYKNYISKRIWNLERAKNVVPLSEKEWAEFKLQQIFNIQKGNQNKMTDLVSGNIPLISAKNGSNGLRGFVSKNDRNIYNKNCLTLNNDGDGGAGIAYYQPYSFLLDSHVTALYPKENFNEYILLFISRCITKQQNKFGHGYSLTNNRLKAFQVMIPINKNKEPDYEFMENYIKRLELEKLKKYLDYKEIK